MTVNGKGTVGEMGENRAVSETVGDDVEGAQITGTARWAGKWRGDGLHGGKEDKWFAGTV